METSISINHLSYALPDGKLLFDRVNLQISARKIGLVGPNGVGKSTLLSLMYGELSPASGTITTPSTMLCEQILRGKTVAEALAIDKQIAALERVEQGSVEEQDYQLIGNDWLIKIRVQQLLNNLGLHEVNYQTLLSQLSGGEKTKLTLVKGLISTAQLLLLDEPTNNLDISAKKRLLKTIDASNKTFFIVSHDRELLAEMDTIVEISSLGIECYGGNYDFYFQQKQSQEQAAIKRLSEAVTRQEKIFKSAQKITEAHQKKASRGREKFLKGKIDKISANSKKGRSEKSQERNRVKYDALKSDANDSVIGAQKKIKQYKTIEIKNTNNKLSTAYPIIMENIYFKYINSNKNLLENFSLIVPKSKRLAVTGCNGCGKTTLIKLILGELEPDTGFIKVENEKIVYFDQGLRALDNKKTILENYQYFNPSQTLKEAHFVLASVLFKGKTVYQSAEILSGGERMRLLLACVLMGDSKPECIILDEPTNHLDLLSIETLEKALLDYQGALIVVSHDKYFLDNIKLDQYIQL